MAAYCLCLQASAQIPAFHFKKAGVQTASIPYAAQNDLIIVSTKLNGKGPFNFILDTGTATSIITDAGLRDLVGISTNHQYAVAGVGTKAPVTALRTNPVHVEMRGVEAPSLVFIILADNTLDLGGSLGIPIHGVMGYDFFSSFVVAVEPIPGRLVLTDPAAYQGPEGKKWSSLPLELEDEKPYISAKIAITSLLEQPVRLMVDTGAGHALSLEANAGSSAIMLPAQRLRTDLGRGFGGLITGHVGRVNTISLGEYRVSSLLASFPDSSNLRQRINIARDGNVGFDLLRRFDPVIDYPHNRLYLRPNRLQRAPFEYDMAGLKLMAAGPQYRQYIISHIDPNSAAAQAGLHPEDEIVSINVLPASDYTLSQLSHLFHSQDGRTIPVVVRRPDGVLFSTMLQLKRQI
ncbi:aspartyl protease family protein [Hymenobacter sp. BT491]|uniref:aspartyl protease family protein n=1 Tax=Hymenobacter sp. BT491 TaxID=2766779 RepID=UPI001653DF39|nr:aspartyl protease family protein [Hymenobacter sp. BT491]MBC6988786.1 aspartyl protease family protein [Hymenobacter sp. BT491]